jgi:hypothetical protein
MDAGARSRRRFRDRRVQPSKLGAQAGADDRDRTTVLVVRGVVDELVVERRAPRQNWETVIGLDYLLDAWMWQLAVTHQDAEASGVEESLMLPRDTADHASDANRIIWPAPSLARQDKAGGQSFIDIGELVGFEPAVR